MVVPNKKLIIYMGITGIEFILIKTSSSGKSEIISEGLLSSISELDVRLENKKGTKVYVILSSKYCYYISLSYPNSAKNKLESIVKLDLIDRIPYELYEIYWDYWVMTDNDKGIKALVCFTPKRDVDELIESIKGLGLRVCGITSSFFCLYSHLRKEETLEEGVYKLEDSEDEIDGIVIQEGKVPRPHPLRHTLPLTRDKNIRCYDLSYDRSRILMEAINQICLRESQEKELSLLKEKFKKDIVIPTRFFFYPIPLLLVVMLSLWTAHTSTVVAEKTFHSGQEVKELKLNIARYKSRLKELKEKKEVRNRIVNFSEQKAKVKDILIELTRIFPKDAYITYFQMQGGRVRIRGEASSALSLVKLLEKSDIFEKCRLVSSSEIPENSKCSSHRNSFSNTWRQTLTCLVLTLTLITIHDTDQYS